MKGLDGMHDEKFPLDADFIPNEFTNTLVTFAEHVNRLKHCQRQAAAKRRIDIYGERTEASKVYVYFISAFH